VEGVKTDEIVYIMKFLERWQRVKEARGQCSSIFCPARGFRWLTGGKTDAPQHTLEKPNRTLPKNPQIPDNFEMHSIDCSAFLIRAGDILKGLSLEKENMETFVVVLMATTILAVLGKVVVVFLEKPKMMEREHGALLPVQKSSRVEFGKRKPQGMP
jgi:hypothetical protein